MTAFSEPEYHECVQDDDDDVGEELNQDELHPHNVDLQK